MPHRPLLNKLDVNSHVLRWVADYLTSRSQCVVVDGDKSDKVQVLSGVPQGSVLGPLFFLIYIDEISSISLSPESGLGIYADDICIYRPISSCRDFKHVQDDIKVVEEWSTENFLNLNPSKCNTCLFQGRGLQACLRDH